MRSPRFASSNARFVLVQPGKSHQPLRPWVSPPSGATGVRLNFMCATRRATPDSSVDCTWEHYQPAAANYLLPRTPDLQLTMVFKNSGDPLDLTHHAHCHRSDCTDEQVALTDGLTGPLRAGLHACALGDVYDWAFMGLPRQPPPVTGGVPNPSSGPMDGGRCGRRRPGFPSPDSVAKTRSNWSVVFPI